MFHKEQKTREIFENFLKIRIYIQSLKIKFDNNILPSAIELSLKSVFLDLKFYCFPLNFVKFLTEKYEKNTFEKFSDPKLRMSIK